MSVELLRDSLEDLYEEAPCGYIFMQPDGTITRVNQTFVDWTGYDRDALESIRFQELLTIPGRIFYENQYAPLLRMQGFVKEVAFDLRCPNDNRLPVLVNSILRSDDTGQPELIASTIFDTTDRQRYEHELRLARERAEQLAAIVTSANDAIVSSAPDGTIKTWNTGAERLFGEAAQAAIGTNIWSVLPALREMVEHERAMADLQTGASINLDTVARHTDGRDLDVSVSLVPHLGLLGDLVGLSAIIRDISDRRALERMQQEFLAMTSHELRHPLANIRGQAQLMRRRSNYSERGLDTIIDQTDRLGRLVDDLLLASLIDANKFSLRLEPTDVVTELRTVAEQMNNTDRAVSIDAPDNAVLISGDRQRLGQVFMNLLTNAHKYSDAGSNILIHVRPEPDAVSIDFVDHGIGIPKEIIPQLFNRFYRADAVRKQVSGLGLGLYISHGIVAAHGGRIDVQSATGVGSTFTVTLPRDCALAS